jgi:hypothetical protein
VNYKIMNIKKAVTDFPIQPALALGVVSLRFAKNAKDSRAASRQSPADVQELSTDSPRFIRGHATTISAT